MLSKFSLGDMVSVHNLIPDEKGEFQKLGEGCIIRLFPPFAEIEFSEGSHFWFGQSDGDLNRKTDMCLIASLRKME